MKSLDKIVKYLQGNWVPWLIVSSSIALVSLSDIWRNKSQEAIQESLNQTLATANEQLDNYKKVSTLVLIKEPFSVENGMLTPTLKTKRSVVNDRYKHLINAWHEDANAVVVEA